MRIGNYKKMNKTGNFEQSHMHHNKLSFKKLDDRSNFIDVIQWSKGKDFYQRYKSIKC